MGKEEKEPFSKTARIGEEKDVLEMLEEEMPSLETRKEYSVKFGTG